MVSEMIQLFPLQENTKTHSEGVYEPQRGPEGSLGASFNNCSDVTLIRIDKNILWKKPQDRWASPIALRNGYLENQWVHVCDNFGRGEIFTTRRDDTSAGDDPCRPFLCRTVKVAGGGYSTTFNGKRKIKGQLWVSKKKAPRGAPGWFDASGRDKPQVPGGWAGAPTPRFY